MLNCIAVGDNVLEERSLWVECPFVVVQYSIRTPTAVNRFLVGLWGRIMNDLRKADLQGLPEAG